MKSFSGDSFISMQTADSSTIDRLDKTIRLPHLFNVQRLFGSRNWLHNHHSNFQVILFRLVLVSGSRVIFVFGDDEYSTIK